MFTNSKNISRACEILVGYTGNWLLVHGFELVLYPFTLYRLGFFAGTIVMSVLSFLLCLLKLRFYDWSKRDWLGIESMKSFRAYSGESRLGRGLARLLNAGDFAASVILSVKFDPFIITAYMRQGKFNGMAARDWKIFVTSWVVGNLYWASMCFGGMSALAWLWSRCHW